MTGAFSGGSGGIEERHLLFAHFLRKPDEELDLAVGALLIAEEEYPGLDVSRYVARIDRLADGARRHVPAAAGGEPALVVAAMRSHLALELGFRGDEENYYDPRNSYLNEVMDRKLGIPITLSLLYIEVGRRLGFDLVGVGFPGHFLVKHVMDRHQIVIDPFFGGRTLDLDDLRQLLQGVAGGGDVEPGHLEAVGGREILARVLRNLRANYLRVSDAARALSAVEKLMLVEPENDALPAERETLERLLANKLAQA
ncbi:MAG: transglutaminase-like domain-containing protein [Myxococcota bacterium]